MRQSIESNHFNDEITGDPDGGDTTATGLEIRWQKGPLGRAADRLEPNGCFVETVIRAAADRLEYYQRSRFASEYNREAIEHLSLALAALERRTADREARQVEGTHEV